MIPVVKLAITIHSAEAVTIGYDGLAVAEFDFYFHCSPRDFARMRLTFKAAGLPAICGSRAESISYISGAAAISAALANLSDSSKELLSV
jgi:hypothetical protein